MKNILIITGRYLPGYKDGGPVRTIKNLTDMFGDTYHFTVACADRDHGDNKCYDGVKVGVDKTNHIGKTDVVYIDNGQFSFADIKTLAKKNDLVYVCGPYNSYAIKSLMLNRLGKINCPFVLAPMGSFSKGALAIGAAKKKVFLHVMKMLGLFNNVNFSVTSEVEEQEMKEALGKCYKCFIAEDPQRSLDNIVSHKSYRENDELKVVFLSRISRKKNLLGAIDALSHVKSNVVFDIYGTMEDKEYYRECNEALVKLPENIKWKYAGEAASEKVPEILSQYDVFLFPTHGENFGHVISEALSAGVIPLISDTTPWLDFEDCNVGYVIPIDDTEKFSSCIDMISEMSCEEKRKMSENAIKYYVNKYNDSAKNNGYVKMFSELI